MLNNSDRDTARAIAQGITAVFPSAEYHGFTAPYSVHCVHNCAEQELELVVRRGSVICRFWVREPPSMNHIFTRGPDFELADPALIDKVIEAWRTKIGISA